VITKYGRQIILDASEEALEMDSDGPNFYEIRVKSRLDESLRSAFGSMQMRYEGSDETILFGPLADQAALHGVLMRIRDLGLPLIAVQQLPTTCNE
jgi:hypothetical protein